MTRISCPIVTILYRTFEARDRSGHFYVWSIWIRPIIAFVNCVHWRKRGRWTSARNVSISRSDDRNLALLFIALESLENWVCHRDVSCVEMCHGVNPVCINLVNFDCQILLHNQFTGRQFATRISPILFYLNTFAIRKWLRIFVRYLLALIV